MTRRVMIASLICAVVCGPPTSVDAQRGNMSDATAATLGLFSRVMVPAAAAPSARPPVFVTSPEILVAFCVERTDAMLVYAALSGETADEPDRTALALLRGGSEAAAAAERTQSALVASGAGSVEAENLVRSANGLLTADFPGVPDVATAIKDYNELVLAAPPTFLADPPAEFMALRHALGRLTAVANTSYSAERVYPDFPPWDVRYADEADWQILGLPIRLLGEFYLQFGDLVEVDDRRFHRVADYEGVWVLSEVTETETVPPSTLYVPLRGQCDIMLQPYVLAPSIIKRTKPNG